MLAFFESPGRVLKISTHMLAGGAAMLAIGVLLAYFLDAYLSIGALVLAHLLTMLGPTSIKIGYVLRLHALYRFNAST